MGGCTAAGRFFTLSGNVYSKECSLPQFADMASQERGPFNFRLILKCFTDNGRETWRWRQGWELCWVVPADGQLTEESSIGWVVCTFGGIGIWHAMSVHIRWWLCHWDMTSHYSAAGGSVLWWISYVLFYASAYRLPNLCYHTAYLASHYPFLVYSGGYSYAIHAI
jgi:hypothetical protein